MESVRTNVPKRGKGPLRVPGHALEELPEPRVAARAREPEAAWHEAATTSPRRRSRDDEHGKSPYPLVLLAFALPLALVLGGTVLVDLFWR